MAKQQNKTTAPATAPDLTGILTVNDGVPMLDLPAAIAAGVLLSGSLRHDFAVTLKSTERRKALKREGLTDEEIAEKMKEFEHKVNATVVLDGMPLEELVNGYALPRMSVEARNGLYKATSDERLARHLAGGVTLHWARLAECPWYVPGARAAQSAEQKVTSGVDRLAADGNVEALRKLQEEIARRMAELGV